MARVPLGDQIQVDNEAEFDLLALNDAMDKLLAVLDGYRDARLSDHQLEILNPT